MENWISGRKKEKNQLKIMFSTSIKVKAYSFLFNVNQ